MHCNISYYYSTYCITLCLRGHRVHREGVRPHAAGCGGGAILHNIIIIIIIILFVFMLLLLISLLLLLSLYL